MNLDRLVNCHSQIARLMAARAEHFGAIQRAEEHRWYWRPTTPRLVLLAESHVHTTEADLKCVLRGQPPLPANMPTGFVRLVYCLGYGETQLVLGASSGRNTGTPQYWQIFHSCIHPVASNEDFREVQASRTRSSDRRITNKVRLLSALKDRGIWLLDASIAALYQQAQPKPPHELRTRVIEQSWDNYVRDVVAEANPEAILCVGIGIARTLQSRLDQLRIPWDAVPQPQARLSCSQRFEVFETFHSVSGDPDSIRKISRKWLQ